MRVIGRGTAHISLSKKKKKGRERDGEGEGEGRKAAENIINVSELSMDLNGQRHDIGKA